MPVDGTTVVERPLPGENEGVRGIYLHIPFCARKCSYCDFYSVAASSPAMTEFRGLLMREMDMVRNRFPEDAAATADTVYFGGGTPTVFPPEALCGLLSATRERFPVEPDAEITAEANPGTVTAEGLRTMREGGFTRVSIGVQSFTPATPPTPPRPLGRIHGVEEVHRTYRDARSAGFHSLGIDLIFGIPGQRTEDWEADLDRTITFLPAHVSAYALAPEPGTPLHAAIGRGSLPCPPTRRWRGCTKQRGRSCRARATGSTRSRTSPAPDPNPGITVNTGAGKEPWAWVPPRTACSSPRERLSTDCGRRTRPPSRNTGRGSGRAASPLRRSECAIPATPGRNRSSSGCA